MNTKGFTKSRETGYLWVLHPDTGRLLPYKPRTAVFGEGPAADVPVPQGEDKVPFDSLVSAGRWYHAQVAIRFETQPGGAPVSREPSGFLETLEPLEQEYDTGSGFYEQVFRHLTETIRQRKISMPEGSYTTHLFREGPDKIKKKLGEEAVELLLSRMDEELVHESADVIYHMLVLFEALNLDFELVMRELLGRSG
ncbi:MAG: phosphoribosyl-ATP diphosphatase, partial [Spirochaetales bacterium]